jgi:N-acetylmuramoyl-L-alanine amidase
MFVRLKKNDFFYIFLFVLQISTPCFSENYIKTTPKKGDGIYGLLRRYHLPTSEQYITKFCELNENLLRNGKELALGRYYHMPIYRIDYNGKTIRSTLNIRYDLAKRIQDYNTRVYRSGLKKQRYTVDKDLWVPYYLLNPEEGYTESQDFTIFGSKYKKVTLIDTKLSNCIFYLVSGHGGPDPGAVGKRGRYWLYEDEYAYDITLRLARRLIEHGTKVYLIVRDRNDGIRDTSILQGDRDEYYYGGIKISTRTVTRLDQRVNIINSLYKNNKNKAKKQYTIVLHVDSRHNNRRIDIYYYYQRNNKASKNLANILYKTVRKKYREHQPGRGYRGTIETRNLHMLRKTLPTTVYIELGNIKNPRDQDRFIETNNRQAVANWLCEGLIESNF